MNTVSSVPRLQNRRLAGLWHTMNPRMRNQYARQNLRQVLSLSLQRKAVVNGEARVQVDIRAANSLRPATQS